MDGVINKIEVKSEDVFTYYQGDSTKLAYDIEDYPKTINEDAHSESDIIKIEIEETQIEIKNEENILQEFAFNFPEIIKEVELEYNDIGNIINKYQKKNKYEENEDSINQDCPEPIYKDIGSDCNTMEIEENQTEFKTEKNTVQEIFLNFSQIIKKEGESKNENRDNNIKKHQKKIKTEENMVDEYQNRVTEKSTNSKFLVNDEIKVSNDEYIDTPEQIKIVNCVLTEQKKDPHKYVNKQTGKLTTKCSYCNKNFRTNWALLQHVRTHTGEKPFHCSICSKAFGQKTHLIQHEKTHSGLRLFECGQCNKKLSRKDKLAQHLKMHTNEFKVFKCERCDKQFSKRRFLSVHMKTHAPYA